MYTLPPYLRRTIVTTANDLEGRRDSSAVERVEQLAGCHVSAQLRDGGGLVVRVDLPANDAGGRRPAIIPSWTPRAGRAGRPGAPQSKSSCPRDQLGNIRNPLLANR
jgi:hypothetical protein